MSVTFIGEQAVFNFDRETIRFIGVADNARLRFRVTKEALLRLGGREDASADELLSLFTAHRPEIESIANSKFDDIEQPISDILIELDDVEAYRAQAE